MKPCTRCECATDLTVDVSYEDPYAFGCSEPDVPLYLTIPEPYCQTCQDKDDIDPSQWSFFD